MQKKKKREETTWTKTAKNKTQGKKAKTAWIFSIIRNPTLLEKVFGTE